MSELFFQTTINVRHQARACVLNSTARAQDFVLQRIRRTPNLCRARARRTDWADDDIEDFIAP